MKSIAKFYYASSNKEVCNESTTKMAAKIVKNKDFFAYQLMFQYA